MQTQDYNNDIIFPQDIYNSYLKLINGISFTPREMEVIACVLSGRAAKRISALLSISPKTVKNHIRNIMLKLDCSSQESIRDFIEKSGKYNIVKKYYSCLLIHATFEAELKKIATLVEAQNPSCLIVYNEKEQHAISLVSNLVNILNIVRVKTSCLVWEKYQDKIQSINKVDFQYTICCFSLSFIDHICSMESVAKIELFDRVPNNSPLSTRLFLLSDRTKEDLTTPKELQDIGYIDFAEQENFYFLVFETLKQMLPTIAVDKNIANFKKQYETFYSPASFQMVLEETSIKPLPNQTKNTFTDYMMNLNFFKEAKLWIFVGGIFCVMVLCALFSIYNGDTKLKPPATLSVLAQLEAGKSASWNLPRQDHLFIGREKLLEALYIKLPFHSNDTLVISACAGLGGVGKTQLALQYIHHPDHPYTLRVWFSAENLDKLGQQHIEFAKMLGYVEEKPSVMTVLPFIKQWLITHPGWLIVYDNVNKYEEIAPFLPEQGGNILITSRSQEWPDKITLLPIDVMEEAEAVKLINKLSNRTEPEIKLLVKTLGYLPLAVGQAGAFIKQNQITVADYLRCYQQSEQLLLADRTMPPGTEHFPVAVTWNVSLAAIEAEAKEKGIPPLARQLLTACAYLEPEGIPKNLLLTWLQKTYPQLNAPEFILDKLLGQLKRYSMITMDDNTVHVHRLIQTTLRSKHTVSVEWYKNLLEASHQEFLRQTKTLEDEKRKKALLPHLQALAKYYSQWSTTKESKQLPLTDFSNTLKDIGFVFFNLNGDPVSAKIYYEEALKLEEQNYGKENWQIAGILETFGNTHRQLGNTKQARALLERALEIKEKHYDEEHLEIAGTLAALGYTHRQLGNTHQAKALLERALEIQKLHHGEDHVQLASTLETLGNTHKLLGDIKQAKILLERAAKLKENHYGTDHYQVAYALSYLGSLQSELGDLKQAQKLLEYTLNIQEQYYGKDHWRCASTMENLGNVYRQLGRGEQAKEILERALAIKEHHYGKEHWQTAYTLLFLANTYGDLGNPKQWKELIEHVLRIQEEFYGKGHWQLGLTLTSLGNAYKALGDTQQAKTILENALKIQEQYYGKEHWQVGYTLTNLGELYKNLGSIEQARMYLESALKIQENYYGASHVEVGKTLTILSKVYKELGSTAQAQELFDRALKIKDADDQVATPTSLGEKVYI